MINYSIIKSYLIVCFCANAIDLCPTGVCLTWKVSENMLILKCKVDELHFRVNFKNPDGKVVGECLPGINPHCEPSINDVAIRQNIETNETICSVNGYINVDVNGIWKCEHGTNLGKAIVEVTVSEGQCIRITMVSTLIGFVVTLLTWSILLYCCKIKPTVRDGFFSRNIKYLTSGSKSAYKTALFALVATVLLFLLSWVAGWQNQENCVVPYIFIGVAIVVSSILILVCLYYKKDDETPESTVVYNRCPRTDQGQITNEGNNTNSSVTSGQNQGNKMNNSSSSISQETQVCISGLHEV